VLAIVAPDGMPLPSGAGGVRYSISTVLVAIAIHISTPLDAGISTPLDAGISTPLDAGISTPLDAGISAPIDAGISTPLDAGISAPLDAGISAPIDAGVSTPIAERSRSDRVVSPTAALGGTGMGARPSLGSV